jgi:hypothetical protein
MSGWQVIGRVHAGGQKADATQHFNAAPTFTACLIIIVIPPFGVHLLARAPLATKQDWKIQQEIAEAAKDPGQIEHIATAKPKAPGRRGGRRFPKSAAARKASSGVAATGPAFSAATLPAATVAATAPGEITPQQDMFKSSSAAAAPAPAPSSAALASFLGPSKAKRYDAAKAAAPAPSPGGLSAFTAAAPAPAAPVVVAPTREAKPGLGDFLASTPAEAPATGRVPIG